MCEKAEEIQKDWKPEDGDKYIYILGKKREIVVWMYGDINSTWEEGCKLIWLPTQEQLQEISQKEYSKSLKKSLVWFGYFVKFVRSKYQDDLIAHEYFNEMNELWLAFLYDEKYHKIWTGEKWEEVKTK